MSEFSTHFVIIAKWKNHKKFQNRRCTYNKKYTCFFSVYKYEHIHLCPSPFGITLSQDTPSLPPVSHASEFSFSSWAAYLLIQPSPPFSFTNSNTAEHKTLPKASHFMLLIDAFYKDVLHRLSQWHFEISQWYFEIWVLYAWAFKYPQVTFCSTDILHSNLKILHSTSCNKLAKPLVEVS